jgi:hypothetical protein
MSSSQASATLPAGGPRSKQQSNLDDLLMRLRIDEDEIDDLVFEDEEDVPKQGMKWTALARVHTANSVCPQTFEQHMRVAWSPAQDIIFTPLEDKLFSVQCSCLGDWIKVKQGGPWLFRQNVVSIEPYDGLAPTESVDLNFINVWIQVHKLQYVIERNLSSGIWLRRRLVSVYQLN